MKKRILAGFLSALMLVGLLPTTALAADARIRGNDYTYTANFALECDKNVTATSSGAAFTSASLKETWTHTNYIPTEFTRKESACDADKTVTVTAAEDYVIDTIEVERQGSLGDDSIFENCVRYTNDYSGQQSVDITLKAPSATTGNLLSPSRDITIKVTAKLSDSVQKRTIDFMIGESGKVTVDGEEVKKYDSLTWKLENPKDVAIEADAGYFIDKVYLDPDAYNTGAPLPSRCTELTVTATEELKTGVAKKGTVTITPPASTPDGTTTVENTLHVFFKKIEVKLYATEITEFYAYNETAQDEIARWEGGADKYLINEFVALEGKNDDIHCTPALTADDISKITVEYLAGTTLGEHWEKLNYEPEGAVSLTRHKFGEKDTETIRFSFGGAYSDTATVKFERSSGLVAGIGVNSQTIEYGDEPVDLVVTWVDGGSDGGEEEFPEEIPDDADGVDAQDLEDGGTESDPDDTETSDPGYIVFFTGVGITRGVDVVLSMSGEGAIWEGIKTKYPGSITLSQLSTELSALGVNSSSALMSWLMANLSITISYGVPTDVGVYGVTAYIAEEGYEPTSATGTLTITRRTNKLKFDPLTFVYDGQPHAPTATFENSDGETVEGVEIECTYYVKGSTEPLSGKPTDVGEYRVTAACTYEGSEVSGQADFEITTAKLELQIDYVEKYVGESDPEFTYKVMRVDYSEDPEGEDTYTEVTGLDLDITLVREPGETVGDYFIYPNTMSGVDDEENTYPELNNANYEWCGYSHGVLTIKERSVTYSVKLSYESNGGTAYPDEYYIMGSTVRLDKTPVRTGYRFTGWYLDRGLTQPVTTIQMYMTRTVYAGWEALYVPSALNSTDHIAYVKGFVDGTVRPEANITRAETAMMIYRLLTSARLAEIYTTENDFSDVSAAAWYNEAVSTMAKGGYINGLPDGTFGGEKNITRAEFAAILVRFIGVQDVTCSFTDVPESHWAYKYIATAAAAGWITGTPDGTFEPNRDITRAEAMAIINRVLNRGVNETSTLLNFKAWPDNAATAWYYYDVIEASNGHTYVGARPSEDWTSVTVS